MCIDDYGIEEHRHRFAAWAASRAASVKGCRFSAEQGKWLIERAGLFEAAVDPANLPGADEFDAAHRGWRKKIIGGAEKIELPFTHGVAAKLINVYLKSMLVCGGFHAHPNVRQVHPPIDGLILGELYRRDCAGLRSVWRELRSRGWSRFDSKEYERAITAIRKVVGDAPLWKIESLWRGYQ